MKTIILQSNSPAETKQIARLILTQLPQGGIILLSGELGTGKTTLVQGLAQGLGIKKRIASPTFVLMKVYPLKLAKIKHLVHIDLYRLTKADSVDNLGIDEYLGQPALVAIEWPQKIKKPWPKPRLEITIKHLTESARQFKITLFAN